MKKSHAGFWIGLSTAFVAVMYSIILFLVKPDFDLAAWVLYGMTMLAFLLFGIQAVASSHTGSGIAMDTTLGIVTAIYLGLQFVFGGIICMCLKGLPLTPVIILELLLLTVYLNLTPPFPLRPAVLNG